MEVPLVNASFTWIRPAGKKSRLDRAFINSEWAKDGDWDLKALVRKNSDHRAIFLMNNKMNWGPRPFRVQDHSGSSMLG